MRPPADFEDFRPGARFEGGPRLVTEADLQGFVAVSGDRHKLHTDGAFARAAGFAGPLMHGPFGIAAFLGWFDASGIAADTAVAMLDSHWRYLAPVIVGDRLHFEMIVTRCRRSSKGDRGVVGRHVRIRNEAGTLVQEGSTALLVRARGDAARPGQEFFTAGWARALAERLGADATFQRATATWDGTFALACGEDEAQFRIFKGAVLEAGTRSPNGPDFTIAAADLTWTELFTAGSNTFMQRAMQGQFSVRGSAYEYLRLTKALDAVIEAARALFREGEP